jgi:hypothetical protein
MPLNKNKKIKAIIKKAVGRSSLVETSYNRVKSHIEGGAAFVIITSDRHERSSKENKKMYRHIKQNYKSAGYPFTEIKGGYKETTKYVKDPDSGKEVEVKLDEPTQVTENAVLVTTHVRPDVKRGEAESPERSLFDFTVEIAQKYNQEAFIFGEEATTKSGQVFKNIRAYDKGGSLVNEPWAGPWTTLETVEGDSDFWSKVKGKHFQLKETEKQKTSQPKSWIEAMKKSRSGEEW